MEKLSSASHFHLLSFFRVQPTDPIDRVLAIGREGRHSTVNPLSIRACSAEDLSPEFFKSGVDGMDLATRDLFISRQRVQKTLVDRLPVFTL